MPPHSNQLKSEPTPHRRRLVSKKLLTLWLTILVVECAAVAIVSTIFALKPSYGMTLPGAIVPPSADNLVSFSLPAPRHPPEPTPLATQVVAHLPTPTQTSTSVAPTQTSTFVAPIPISTPVFVSSTVTAIITPTEAPTSTQIQHVIIISIDGLRPDALFAADAPHLDDLISQGAYCPSAQTVTTSETLPSHASMLTGMLPEKHGILWGVPYMGWPGMHGPTLFSIVHEAGLTSAMVFGKQKMNYLVLPNSVDKVMGMDAHDPEIKEWALEIIHSGLPNALFIHFPDTDRVGHAYGWMSPNQFYAITFVDGLIGELVADLESEGYFSSTLMIITADHGGHGFRHGDDSPEDRTIPWLAVGPGVPAGVTLTGSINTYDTAPTVLHALNLPIPAGWDGKPVLEIFD